MLTPADILGEHGPLARAIQGYTPRPAQQAMAQAITAAIEARQTLITEAGTGTGKTFAYLVPALLSGRKVIISTGTRNLQDQLFHRDLPVVRDVLAVPVSVCLLKGRSNYLCLNRLAKHEAEGRYRAGSRAADFVKIRAWAGRTRRGDIAELAAVAEDSPVWSLATSTAENCLGQECPEFSDCFLLKARRAAQEAEVVIINHHLLCADLVLKDEGFGDILPGADTFIIDEAHQLPEVAGMFFGLSVSARQLLELARDTLTEQIQEASDMPDLADAAQTLQITVQALRLAFGLEPRRGAWSEVAEQAAFQEALSALQQALAGLGASLEPASVRSKGLEHCAKRTRDLGERLDVFAAADGAEHVQWFETHAHTFRLNLTPLDIADTFRGHMERYPSAWVFTSATLAVGESFDYFAKRLGLTAERAQRFESPFDFTRQAVLYLPPGMPEPRDYHYTRAIVEAVIPVLEASRGRAFFLFTSHRGLQEAVRILKERIDYPLLVQGSAPRTELVDRFRCLGNAVLLGTASFWEGVDVRGPALSCVIIDKLPFAAPDDPVLKARIDALKQAGANPFMDYQLPHAVIALKQGVGRLIRDITDRGALVICDPRFYSRGYGRVFRESLPPMPVTRRIEDIQAFFAP